MKREFTAKDYWRFIILYGLNQATYKMALAKCLNELSQSGRQKVSLDELSKLFFSLYQDRLVDAMPQLNSANQNTVVERVNTLYNEGKLSLDKSVSMVKKQALPVVLNADRKSVV